MAPIGPERFATKSHALDEVDVRALHLGSTAAVTPDPTLKVTTSDVYIHPGATTVRGGKVRATVDDTGSPTHEVVFLRTDTDAAKLHGGHAREPRRHLTTTVVRASHQPPGCHTITASSSTTS